MSRNRRASWLAGLGALLLGGVGGLAWLGDRAADGLAAPGSAGAVGVATPLRRLPAGERGAPERAASVEAPSVAAGLEARERERVAAERPGSGVRDAAGEQPAQVWPAPLPWSGRVLAADSGDPIEGVRVVLLHASLCVEAQTDAAGAFALEWPAGIAPELAVLHPRYVDQRVAEAVLERDAVLRLEPAARLRGAVAGWPPAGLSADAAPAALLWPHDGEKRLESACLEAPLDAQGRFFFADLEPGAWNLTVRVPGGLVEEQGGLQLAPGETREVELKLKPGGVLRGRIELREGRQPVPDVEVAVRGLRTALPSGAAEDFVSAARTAADGSFEVTGLAPGAQRVEVRLPWGGTDRASATIPATLAPVELVIGVASPASIRGLVVDAAGAPVGGALVLALPREARSDLEEALAGHGAALELQATADGEGAFFLPAVQAEEALTLLAFAPAQEGPGAAGSTLEPPLAAGEARTGALVRLPAGAALAGRVLGLDGLPPPSASVSLAPLHGGVSAPLAVCASDAEGFFRFEAAPVGTVELDVDAEGYRPRRLRVGVPPEGALDVRVELEPAFAVEGRVVDEGGAGRSGLHVRLALDPASAEPGAGKADGAKGMQAFEYTDGYGRFRFEGLRRGRWTPSLRSSEWELVGATPAFIDLPGDGELVLELRKYARPALASVSGEVFLRDGGAALDVRVGGVGPGTVLTTEGASFIARGVEPGEKHLQVIAEGCVPERLGPLELVPGAELDLGRIELERGTRLDVRVRTPEGKPLDGAKVTLRPLPAEKGGPTSGAWTWRLDRRGPGLYRLALAPRGRWRLHVACPGWKPHQQVLQVGENPSAVSVPLLR